MRRPSSCGRIIFIWFAIVLSPLLGILPISCTGEQITDPPLAASASTTASGKLALLVGISDYRSADITDLSGCVNDVHEMKKLLVGKFEFSEQDIATLTNSDATRANILKGFKEHVIAKARAFNQATGNKPIVVFHYSGHGGQVIDKSTPRDETDGLDETIVPHDSMRPEDDITDDELNELFTELAQITDNVTYVFDSCHSGTATKGFGQARLVNRQIPNVQAVRVEASEPGNTAYALITGCRSEERSYEYTDELGMTHGTLSFFLTRVLWASDKGQVTYRDVMDIVKSSASSVRPQTPQLSGAKLDNFVFGDAASLAKPYLRIIRKGNEIGVEAGKAHGLTEKSKLAVYAPGTKLFADPNKPVATIELTSVRAFDSSAKHISGEAIPPGARGVVVEHAMQAQPFPVFLDYHKESHDDAIEDAPTLNAVRKAIQQDMNLKDNIRIVDRIGDAHLTVSVRKNGTILITGQRIVSPPIPKQDGDAIPRVLRQLAHWAHWYNLTVLANSNSGLRVDFRIEGPARDKDQDGVTVYRPGDEVKFIITNQSARPVYFSILDLTSDGEISQLWPDPGFAEALPAEATWRESTITSLKEDQSQVFDYIKLLVFDRPTDTFFLTTDAAPKGSESFLFPFAAAVQKAPKGLHPIRPDSWSASRLELKVVRP